MELTGKKKYFYFISFMIMMSTFLPILFNNLPPVFRSHHIWTLIWFLSLLMIYPQIFRFKLFIATLIYGLFVIGILLSTVWLNIDDFYKHQVRSEFYEIIVGVSIISYYLVSKDYIGLTKLVKWSLFFIFITTVMTIITTNYEPLYIRTYASLSGLKDQHEIDYLMGLKKWGGSNYGFVAGILSLIPAFIYLYRTTTRWFILNKYFIALYIILIFYALLSAQLFANILLAVIIIILSLREHRSMYSLITLSAILIFIFLLIPNQSLYSLLLDVSSLFPSDSNISFKLKELGIYALSGSIEQSNAIEYRYVRYPMLLESFYSNPFFGYYFTGKTFDIVSGSHLHWMSKLTVFGLLGGLPFFYILYMFIKQAINRVDPGYKYYLLLSFLSIVVLGFFKALSGREMWYIFFIILPGINFMKRYNKWEYKKN